MKKQIINTFAIIGAFTIITIACSTAIYDDDINLSNSSTNTNNAVVQSGIGKYAISCAINNSNRLRCAKINTETGSITLGDSSL